MLLTKQKHRHIHTWFLFCLSACVCVRSLFETPFPLNDSLPNCPNYCTSCGFILKRADMFLTKLYTDLLPNVSDTNPLPSFDTHWFLLVYYTLNTQIQKGTVHSMFQSCDDLV